MKKTVLIIEDSPTQLEVLRRLVLEVNSQANVLTACDEANAYKLLMEKTVDIFMADIILDSSKPGDLAGIKLVERIRTIPKYMFTPVLFITSLEDSSGYAYRDLNCLGYVEKPFNPKQIKDLLKKAMNYSTEKNKEVTMCFRKDGILFPIKVKEIVYIESRNHTIYIHKENGEEIKFPYMTCKQLLEETDTDDLMQCSRNTIVNKDYIYNIDLINRFITMKKNFNKVEIGITYKKKVIAEYEPC